MCDPNIAEIKPNWNDVILILLQIGTTKLSYIGRGYVKLGRVPKLCHPDNIDWSRIGKNTVAVYQPYSKDCPPCPSDCNGKVATLPV